MPELYSTKSFNKEIQSSKRWESDLSFKDEYFILLVGG